MERLRLNLSRSESFFLNAGSVSGSKRTIDKRLLTAVPGFLGGVFQCGYASARNSASDRVKIGVDS